MKQQSFLILFSLCLTLFSCRRDKVPEFSLPLISETGKNTLGFLLDNKVWVNYGRRCTIAGCKNNTVQADFFQQPNGDYILSVQAGYTISEPRLDQLFAFSTTNITTTGTYSLDSTSGHQVLFVENRSAGSYNDYNNRLPNNFSITITKFDTINNIVAGTFNGILYNRLDQTDSIFVKDGRFDTKLNYIR